MAAMIGRPVVDPRTVPVRAGFLLVGTGPL